MNFNSPLVALEGFEPSQAEPESDVLPLHHKAIFRLALSGSLAAPYRAFASAKLCCFFYSCKFFRTFFVVFSDVESEVHYITVLHDVVFAFDRQAAGVADGRFAAKADVVVVFDDFGADESFLEVGVDDAGTFGCF